LLLLLLLLLLVLVMLVVGGAPAGLVHRPLVGQKWWPALLVAQGICCAVEMSIKGGLVVASSCRGRERVGVCSVGHWLLQRLPQGGPALVAIDASKMML
jgi:hypothetical protein